MEVTNEIIRKRVVADIFRCSEDDSIFNEEDDTVDEDTVRNENSMNADIEEVSSMDDGLHIFYQGDDEDVKGIDMSETTMNEDEGPRPGMWFPSVDNMFMRGHRKLTLNMKRVLEANDICGIRPSKSIRMLEVEVGGLENLSCLAKDCRNFIENKRRLQLGDGDAGATSKMPFATIVGVNHHGQSILLGCALISHEDADTFKWLFNTWIEAKGGGGVHPDAIITDQCEVPEKFRSANDYESISHEFKAVIYDSLSIEMFKSNWNNFLTKQGMERNEWLIKLYSERENWVLVYLNHRFWARMVSTQRSEGMHAYFDGYVNSRSTLKQFVEQYEIAIRDKTVKEFHADHLSKYNVIKCQTNFKWERQYQVAFTNSMFKQVQAEIKRMLYCFIIHPKPVEAEQYDIHPGVEKVKVMERSILNDWYVKEFVYEFINERYLIKRWRKDVVRPYSKIFFDGPYPQMPDDYKKYKELERSFGEVSDLGLSNNEMMEIIKQRLNELNQGDLTIRDPKIITSRGRPRENRYKSSGEKKKKSTPSGSRGNGGHGRERGRGRGSNNSKDSNLDQNQQIELAGRDQPPSVGMYYASIDILFDAYLSYAREKGFSVAKKPASKGNGNVHKYQTISCDRGRKSYAKSISKRINCPACLSAILKSNGFWQVTKLQTQHNHELDPNMSRFMRAHSSIPSAIKRRLEAHDIAGIRPSKSVRLLEVQAGGSEKLSCLPRDYRNFINISRRRKLGNGDAGCINRMFLRMQQQNTNFFHLIDIDEDQRLTNVFWVHSRSIAAYEEFCDVISVDTTCLINRYRMPFASIIGVNHHDQSILLGSALISHKDAKTFRWVFSTWLAAMCGGAPNAILTDQCESMKSTIREVMPNTTHRFCIWHILCKVPEKLRRVQEYDKASKEFIALIYDSLSPTMFERNCHEFVVKYNLEGEDVNEGDEELIELGFEQHKILERSLMNDWYVKQHVYTVLYNKEGSVFKCNCRKFESNGILCAHILKLEFQNWDGRSNNANDNVNGDALDDGDGDLQTQTMIVRNRIVASSRGRPWGSRSRSAFERRPNRGSRGRS
ncbi:protein FAR-RED IMPAIRED RESPONSE 1-like [Hevea brasiliensis]|uniref:protein FAR-RED IMPAIRED RESPONSE 1-like n=1 Tax=Hevea brasiliensis TaxID=3981 RepID=UPI0025F47AB1|nr:protein FAR-RED IMPAIRED RESPONSE 1-like [Hevea brasiliensis]